MFNIHPYFPSMFQGPNLRQEELASLQPLPFYYESWFPAKVFLIGMTVQLLDNYLLSGILSGLLPVSPLMLSSLLSLMIFLVWSRVCIWTHSLWPRALQSNFVAHNRRWDVLKDVRVDTS